MKTLRSLPKNHSRTLWLLWISSGLAFESIALYYQYVLDFPPCVVCIHVRILLASGLTLSLMGFYFRGHRAARSMVLVLMLANYSVLIERSWELLGTERGFIMGSCSFDIGLPKWFALDQWFPLIFKVHSTCGYTPEIAFGISMAEALFVSFCLMFSVILGLLYREFHGIKNSLC
ncbi:MAG: disulfide bond formation protein B [Cycloclasticus sp.]